jgi:hypothetical protein
MSICNNKFISISKIIVISIFSIEAMSVDVQQVTPPDLMDKLFSLKPLPKVHYSWRLPDKLMEDRESGLLYEYCRITQALSFAGEYVTERQIDNCVYTCARINRTNPKIPSSIAINYSPWHRKLPKDVPVTYRGPEYFAEIRQFSGRLNFVKEAIAKSNRKYGSSVEVSAILLDCERFGRNDSNETSNDAMREALDAIHAEAARIFPRARIEWYGRGIVRADGITFSRTVYFTGKEIMPTLSCSFYTLPEMEGMRETFRRTCELADSYGVTEVTPWVALASGYKHDLIKKLKWTQDWDYDLIYSYQLGAELNVPFYGNHPERYAPYNRAKVVAFFPAPFNNGSPAWAKHFIAYVRGATEVVKLDDLGYNQ